MKILFYRTVETGLKNFSISNGDYDNFATKYPKVFSAVTVDGYHLIDESEIPKIFDVEKDFTVLTDGYSGYHSLWEVDGYSNYDGYNIFVTVAESLGPIKREVYKSIDANTGTAMLVGFSYGGMQFSLSVNAQVKWSGLYAARDMISYPLIVPNIDDSDGYTVNNSTIVGDLYQLAVDKVRESLDDGRELKEEVRALTTLSGIQTFVTNNLTSFDQRRLQKLLT